VGRADGALAQGDRLKEAQNINKSLSALGDCVQSLVAKAKHVPFRNSKLTFLLQVGRRRRRLPRPVCFPAAPGFPAASLHFEAKRGPMDATDSCKVSAQCTHSCRL
jgi:hypothetical protein